MTLTPLSTFWGICLRPGCVMKLVHLTSVVCDLRAPPRSPECSGVPPDHFPACFFLHVALIPSAGFCVQSSSFYFLNSGSSSGALSAILHTQTLNSLCSLFFCCFFFSRQRAKKLIASNDVQSDGIVSAISMTGLTQRSVDKGGTAIACLGSVIFMKSFSLAACL